MARMMKTLLFLSTLTFSVDAYWLMSVGEHALLFSFHRNEHDLTFCLPRTGSLMVERRDPIVAPGTGASAHVHSSEFPLDRGLTQC